MAISSLQSGLNGIYTGMQSMNARAEAITKSAVGGDMNGLTEAVVGLNQDELQVKASVKVLQTANDTLGSLLDIKA